MADWINKIDGPNDERLSCIENVDYAISFNYTKTLEHIYGVDRESTFYIHNTPGGEYYGFISVDRLCEIIDWSGIHLIFGHGARDREPQRFDNPIPSMTRDYDNNAAHFRLESAYELLNGFYEEAAKKTEAVIPELGHFLRYASDVKRVYIIGHSLSDVEMHYFQVNAGHFGSDVEYHVSYFATDDEEETERANLEYQVAQFLSKKARRAFYNLARPDCPLRHTANLDGQ